MQYLGFHHIGLIVQDTQRSFEFYTEALGGEEMCRFPMGGDVNRMAYMVKMGPGAVVEILPGGTGEPEVAARFAHIALQTKDARAAFAAAIAAGAVEKSAPKDVALGDALNACIAFVFGPDGESVEFFEEKA